MSFLQSQLQNTFSSFESRSLIIIFLLILSSFFLYQVSSVLLLLPLLLVLFFYIVTRPKIGLYLTAAFSLFIGLRLDFSQFRTIFEDLSILAFVSAPLVDFAALATLIALIFTALFKINGYSFSYLMKKDYSLKFYLPFLLSGLISSYLVLDPSLISSSLYYYVRNIAFVFFAFVFMPVAIIRDRETLERVLWILFWAGLGVAVFGLISLLDQLGTVGWARVTPMSIYGIAPLKYNHNILAESLVAVAPLAVYLSITRTERYKKKLMFVATSFIISVCILTLSRAAWLSLMVQAVIAAFVFKDRVKNFFSRREGLKYLLLIAVIPAVAYMFYFLTSQVVTSSNRWRIEVLNIVWFYFQDAPIFGYGPGIFISMLEQVKAYTLQFGAPLDAHGFVQKITLEQGLFGLVTFAGFLIAVFYKIWKRQRRAHIGRLLIAALLISAGGAVFFQFFNTSYYSAHMWLPLGLAIAGSNVFEKIRF